MVPVRSVAVKQVYLRNTSTQPLSASLHLEPHHCCHFHSPCSISSFECINQARNIPSEFSLYSNYLDSNDIQTIFASCLGNLNCHAELFDCQSMYVAARYIGIVGVTRFRANFTKTFTPNALVSCCWWHINEHYPRGNLEVESLVKVDPIPRDGVAHFS